MKNLKQNTAITLVALVITIVLLILSAVTLNMVLGENGIIAKAKHAKEEYERAAQNEEQSLNDLYRTT